MYRVVYSIHLMPDKSISELQSWAKMNFLKFKKWGARQYSIERPIHGEVDRFLLTLVLDSIDKWEEGVDELTGTVLLKDLAAFAFVDDIDIEVTRIVTSSES